MKIHFVARRFALILGVLTVVSLSISSILKEEPPKPKSPLAVYGEYVYKREKCYKCHTFFEEEATKKLISLDGYGKEHTIYYTYEYILDPKAINPYSKKKSNHSLFNNEIKSARLATLLEINQEANLELQWVLLEEEADSIIKVCYVESDKNVYYNELTALISYLHNMPKSKAKRIKDSIALDAENRAFEEMIGPNSVLMQTANLTDAETIEKGEMIFKYNCVACHPTGGGVAIDLRTNDYVAKISKEYLAAKIVKGEPKRGMAAWGQILRPEDIGSIIAYLETFKE
jgi:mono/diheme cytochrome c family protein